MLVLNYTKRYYSAPEHYGGYSLQCQLYVAAMAEASSTAEYQSQHHDIQQARYHLLL